VTRVIYDTTVFLSGLLNPHGKNPKLFELPSEVELILSDTVAEEIFKVVLQAASLREALPSLQSITLEEISAFINEQNMVPIDENHDIQIDICAEAHDNKFLISALALECDLLVTAVPDLLALEGNQNWEEFKTSNNLNCRILDIDTFLSLF
jgi:putative PIN family toxin of toxin-antitoxin system